MSEAQREDILRKIQRLIAHAEGTRNEGEAANYWAKAQELMQKYQIDEALARAAGRQVREKAVGRKVQMFGTKGHSKKKMQLLNVVCQRNRCKLIDCYSHMVIVGMESDAEFCEMLWTSLILEGWRWMLADMPLRESWISRPTFANNWLEAFTNRINARMIEANKRVEESYPVNQQPGVALALRGTQDIVLAKLEELFPSLKKGRASSSRKYSAAANLAGRMAGDRANISGSRKNLRETKSLEG